MLMYSLLKVADTHFCSLQPSDCALGTAGNIRILIFRQLFQYGERYVVIFGNRISYVCIAVSCQ